LTISRLATGDVCLLNPSDTFDGATSRFDEGNLTVPAPQASSAAAFGTVGINYKAIRPR